MKKITTLLSLALLVGFGMNAQDVNVVTAGEPTSYTYENATNDECTVVVARDNYWGGAINSTRYASKFSLEPNTVFQPGEVVMLVGSYNDPTYEINEDIEFKFTFYKDPGYGEPGDEITSTIIAPSSSMFIESITAGANSIDVYEITVDLSGMGPIEPIGAADTDFFFGIEMADDDGIQVGLNFTLSAAGSITYYHDTDTNEWAAFNASAPDDVSFTYHLSGQCDALSVNDHALSQVSVYPNPTTGILNVQTPSSVDVSSVALFDILGKEVISDYNNGTINMSNLSQGIYLLKVETSAGILTQKIVKQ